VATESDGVGNRAVERQISSLMIQRKNKNPTIPEAGRIGHPASFLLSRRSKVATSIEEFKTFEDDVTRIIPDTSIFTCSMSTSKLSFRQHTNVNAPYVLTGISYSVSREFGAHSLEGEISGTYEPQDSSSGRYADKS